jgi:hypothetical protein
VRQKLTGWANSLDEFSLGKHRLPKPCPSQKENKTMFRISAYPQLLMLIAATMLGLALMMTPLCYGQASYSGPPHNIIYWDGDPDNLQALVSSPLTDVIVYFAVPNGNCFLSWEGGEPANLQNSIQALHNAGKTVLASFGGSDVQSSQYRACYGNMGYLLSQLNWVVTAYGFDGVDIDFEDTDAFKGKTGYDGVDFLTQLTNDLYYELPQWHNIITHAPQTPYFMEN